MIASLVLGLCFISTFRWIYCLDEFTGRRALHASSALVLTAPPLAQYFRENWDSQREARIGTNGRWGS